MTYQEFITNIVETRGRKLTTDEYKERHHIIPKCMGGSDDQDNIVELLAEEHYTAHKLLAEENPECSKLQQAWACMTFMHASHHQVTEEEFARARREQAKISSERLKGKPGLRLGVPTSEETKQKLRDANLGKTLPPETRAKIAEASSQQVWTEERKLKISAGRRGKLMPEESKKKCSIAMMGNKNALGHKKSQESIAKALETRRANGNWSWSEERRLEYKNAEHHWNLSDKTKQRISESRKGIKFTDEHKQHLSEAQRGRTQAWTGKVRSKEHIDKIIAARRANGTNVAANKGKMCITDGLHNRYIAKDDFIPEGWHKGSTQRQSKTS